VRTDGRKDGRKKASHDILPVHSVHLADIKIQFCAIDINNIYIRLYPTLTDHMLTINQHINGKCNNFVIRYNVHYCSSIWIAGSRTDTVGSGAHLQSVLSNNTSVDRPDVGVFRLFGWTGPHKFSGPTV